MVKHILLKMDEAMYFKMLKDKIRREEIMGKSITWEEYTKLLFGFSKAVEK